MDKKKMLLDRLDEETKCKWGFERGFYLLLRAFENDLPEINSYFHKAFRQADVTNSGKVDMAIWQMLQESETFWNVLDEFVA